MEREEIKNQLWEIVRFYNNTLEEKYKFFNLLKKYREEDLLKNSLLRIRQKQLKEDLLTLKTDRLYNIDEQVEELIKKWCPITLNKKE